jgi:hypothetical protein
MAYAKRKAPARRRAPARRATRAPARRSTTARRSMPQTVKIVIEHSQAPAMGNPVHDTTLATAPRRAKF